MLGWSALGYEFRGALQGIRKDWSFSLLAVATAALGIGASTAIFTIVDTTVLKPLQFEESGRLVAVWEKVKFLGPENLGPNPRHVDFFRKHSLTFSDITFLRQASIGLASGNEHPQLVGTVLAVPNLFEVLRVKPLLGRTLSPEDGTKGRDSVMVLTHKVWKSYFRGDPNVVGTVARLGDVPRQVVGVLPENFHFPNRNALRAFSSKQAATSVPEPGAFVPAVLDLTEAGWGGEYGNWVAIGRLKAGIELQQAQAELDVLMGQILEQMPVEDRKDLAGALRGVVQPMQEAVTGDSQMGLWLLMAAVLGLMLIACFNLATAQLARALSRRHEASVRKALGASKWRLLARSVLENLILAAMGGAAGVLLAHEGLELFRAYSWMDLPRLSEVQVNQTVLWFSGALIVGTAMLSSLVPALSLLGSSPQSALVQGGSRSVGNSMSSRIHSGLIGVQVFGCTVLLLATGLVTKNLIDLVRQDKGFVTAQVAFAQVSLSGYTYGPQKIRVGFIDTILQDLASLPGVQSAGYVSALPLEGESFVEELGRVDRPKEQSPIVNLRWVSPGLFESINQKLIAGRFFEERDRNAMSAILTEGVAKALWKGESPIGGMVRTQGREFQVIGVVADARSTSLKSAPAKIVYLHYSQRTGSNLFFLARGSQPAAQLAQSMRDLIWKRAPQVAIVRAKTMDAQLNESLSAERFQSVVLVSFAAAALLLAMLGIYGMLSYTVAERRKEIGVRIALGASRGRIYAQVLWVAGVPVLTGLVAGVIGSLAAATASLRLVEGAAGIEPLVGLQLGLAVTGLFLMAAGLAGFLPARRAVLIEPMEALRGD